MSLNRAELEASIRRKDPTAVRDLLKDATESDRAACAKALKPLLRGPAWPDHDPILVLHPEQFTTMLRSGGPGHFESLRDHDDHKRRCDRCREYDEWRDIANGMALRLAALGLAGGVAAAARLAAEFRHGTSLTEIDLVAAVLADRRPRWLADFAGRHLRLWGQHQIGIPAWPLARRLVRLGAIARPDVPEYTTLLPWGVRWTDDNPDGGPPRPIPDPAQALLADPGLLEDEVWRLFTVPDAARALERQDRDPWWQHRGGAPAQTWAEGLAYLCGHGHLDRDRLLDACLDAFTRDFNPNRVSWYAAMLQQLDPSVDEIATRAGKYLGLLAVTSKPGVAVAQQGARRLLDAGLLDAGQLLEASGPALLFPQKSIAIAQLKLIGKVMATTQGARPQAAATAAVAFGHERQDVQEAALALIRKHGVPAGAPLAEIRLRAMDLSPSLRAEAVALGLAPDSASPLGTTAARAIVGDGGGVPGPAQVQPEAGAPLPPPVTDPDELVQLLTILVEDARDAIAAERALAGAVRLSGLPHRQRRRAAAPLLKRAQAIMNIYVPFSGDLITSDIALVAHVWGGEPLPAEDVRRESRWHSPGAFAVGSTGRALTMAGIFSARAWEAARIIEVGEGGLLLAEPETERAAITADTMLQRVQQLAQHRTGTGPASPYDHDVALLRLAPEDAGPLWTAWAPLAETTADALRASHQLVQVPPAFAAVAGQPSGKPLRSSHHWHTHLLARTVGPVTRAPGCPSWQLLTGLADPLSDHEVLAGPSRYQLRHYDAAVAGWPLICPWQPDLAAAHLLRPLCDGLIPGLTPATTAILSLSHPGHPLGPVGHLVLVTGLASAAADTRIAAAQLWSDACADGRLDPALAAAAIVTGVGGDALKLNRITDGLGHASHTALAARRVVETICHSVPGLAASTPANLHLLIEIAAGLGARVGVPSLPRELTDLASRGSTSRLTITARQLIQAGNATAPDREQAAIQATRALATRAPAPCSR